MTKHVTVHIAEVLLDKTLRYAGCTPQYEDGIWSCCEIQIDET